MNCPEKAEGKKPITVVPDLCNGSGTMELHRSDCSLRECGKGLPQEFSKLQLAEQAACLWSLRVQRL